MAVLLLVVLWSSPALALSVVVLGDSHTGVIGPQVARRLEAGGHTVQVVYHNSWSTRSYLRRPRGFPRLHHPELAVVILGGNNRIFTPSTYRVWVYSFLCRLRREGVRHVLWVGPLPADRLSVRSRHQTTRELQRSLFSRRGGVTWLDPSDFFRSFSTRADGTHYRFPAYSKFSNYLAKATQFMSEEISNNDAGLQCL